MLPSDQLDVLGLNCWHHSMMIIASSPNLPAQLDLSLPCMSATCHVKFGTTLTVLVLSTVALLWGNLSVPSAGMLSVCLYKVKLPDGFIQPNPNRHCQVQ